MWTVVPDIYNVFTAPQIRGSLFNWTYVRCYWRYIDNSMCVILQTWCQIQRTSSSLRCRDWGPGHIQCNYSSTYLGFNSKLNVSALLCEISLQLNALHTANVLPNIAHILQFALCQLWSRTYTMYLLLHIFRIQYSTERTCADIGDMSTIQCALYCKHDAKCSAHPPVYAVWTVDPAIYNVITAPHIQSSIFNWTCLRCCWRYIDNSMCAILQTWCKCSAHPPVLAIWTVVPDIYNLNTALHIQSSIINWTYLRYYPRYLDNWMRFILQTWCQI
jgi:hypothetical protein